MLGNQFKREFERQALSPPQQRNQRIKGSKQVMSALHVIQLARLRATNSPIRLEVLDCLKEFGAQSADELASHVDKDERLIYYHLRELIAAGLIYVSGSRPTATRPESLFAARDLNWMGDLDLSEVAVRKQVRKNVQAILSAAGEDHATTVDELQNESQTACTVERVICRVSPSKRAEFGRRLDELKSWLLDDRDPEGEKYAFTIISTPTR